MNIIKAALSILIALVLALAAFAAGSDFAGTWVGTAELPDQTIDEVTVILEKTEAGYMGKISDALGVLAPETPLVEAAYDGRQLKLVFPTADGVLITVQAKPEGEKLAGFWTDEDNESGKIALARKK